MTLSNVVLFFLIRFNQTFASDRAFGRLPTRCMAFSAVQGQKGLISSVDNIDIVFGLTLPDTCTIFIDFQEQPHPHGQ